MSKVILVSSEKLISKSLAKHYPTNPKILFIRTASNCVKREKPWLEEVYESMKNAGFELILYDLEDKNQKDFEKDCKDLDGIHLGGGTPDYLLYHIRKSGFDRFLEENKEKYIISGASAGAIVLSNSIESSLSWDCENMKLDSYVGLGFTNFEIMPHFQAGKHQDEVIKCFEDAVKIGNNGVNLNDHSYIVQENGMFKIIDMRDEE